MFTFSVYIKKTVTKKYNLLTSITKFEAIGSTKIVTKSQILALLNNLNVHLRGSSSATTIVSFANMIQHGW